MCHQNILRNRCGHTIREEIFRCGKHVDEFDRAVAAGHDIYAFTPCVAGKLSTQVKEVTRPCVRCEAEEEELARAMGREKAEKPRKGPKCWIGKIRKAMKVWKAKTGQC